MIQLALFGTIGLSTFWFQKNDHWCLTCIDVHVLERVFFLLGWRNQASSFVEITFW